MIVTIPQPSMAVHAHDVPGFKYKMFNTWPLDPDENMEHIADWVSQVATDAPGGHLRSLIFNCHGSCGSAKLSNKARLTVSTVGPFSKLKNLVNHILIIACTVIRVKPGDNANFWSDPGVRLCYELATKTKARVYASNEYQYVNLGTTLFGGFGDIDEYEGFILSVPPTGQCAWLPSNYALALMLKSL
jgi:hypothetical protein